MESLSLVVSIMLFISILGAPLGWLTLKIPTNKPSTTAIKKVAAFIFSLFSLMLGVTILSTGPAIGGVLIALYAITASTLMLIKIWRDQSYWEQ